MNALQLLDELSRSYVMHYDDRLEDVLRAALPASTVTTDAPTCHVLLAEPMAPTAATLPDGPDGTACVLVLGAAVHDVPLRAWARALAQASFQIVDVVSDAQPGSTTVALLARRTRVPLPTAPTRAEAMYPRLPDEQEALYLASRAAVLELELTAGTAALVAELQRTIELGQERWQETADERRAGERAVGQLEAYRESRTYRVASGIRRIRKRIVPQRER